MTQYAAPVYLPTLKDQAIPLQRVSLAGDGEGRYSENDLQKLLFENPATLPTGEFDDSFKDPVPVCRELGTPNGPLDLLYVTPGGGIVLIEVKLWRNPEARRKVVAQALDYATAISQWDYDRLSSAVQLALGKRDKSLYDIVAAASAGVEERAFCDAVTRNLRRGQFLVLVVGDGIQQNAEELAAFIDRPGLEFTFGLIEVAMYRTPQGGIFVQPRLLAKTMILRRIVVALEEGVKGRVEEDGPRAERRAETEANPQAKFFEDFWGDLVTRHLRLNVPGQPQPKIPKSTNIFLPMPPSGSTSWVSGYLAQSNRRAGVYLRLSKGGFGDEAWPRLLAQSEEINRELGEPAIWQEEEDRAYSVVIRTPMKDLKDAAEQERIKRWLAEKLVVFAAVFRPRLEAIEKSI